MIIKKYIQLLDTKSQIVLKNVLYSSLIKGINIGMNFLTVPLILSFLDTTRYGIWLTLSAVLSWFSLFDLGLGNGLRNKLTIALAEENYKDAKIYISTTYILLGLIFGILFLLFITINPFINWLVVFNVSDILYDEIKFAVLICISCIFFQLVLRLVNTILLSLQKAAIADFINAIIQIVVCIGLLFLKLENLHTLKSITLIFALVPIFVFLVVNIYVFSTTLKHIRPSFSSFRKKYVRSLFNLGISFFLIQIAALVLYATDNFIITQMFAPADVSTYNVAYKYFSITNLALTIFLPSFWSMTTKAFAESDFGWIKNTMNKLFLIWLILAFIGFLQLLVAPSIYHLWTGGKIKVPFQLSLVLYIYYLIYNIANILSNFLNAVGKVQVQLLYSLVSMVVNFPIAYLLVKYFNLGMYAIPLATSLIMLIGAIISYIQYYYCINKNNNIYNIWAK